MFFGDQSSNKAYPMRTGLSYSCWSAIKG